MFSHRARNLPLLPGQDGPTQSLVFGMTAPWPWLTFPEVHSLEDISGVDAIAFGCLQKLRDLLHLLEGHGGGLNLLHWGLPLRVQSINELTQHLGEDSSCAEVRLCLLKIRMHHPQLQKA